jgi:hypothetical protein
MAESYCAQVSDAYLEATGKIHVSPMDWQIIAEWEEKKIPIFIPLKVIEEVAARKKKVVIRGMSYFVEEVLACAAEYREGQVGKHYDSDGGDDMV